MNQRKSLYSTSLSLFLISVLEAEIYQLSSAVCLKLLHVRYTEFLRESCFLDGIFETSSKYVGRDDLKTKERLTIRRASVRLALVEVGRGSSSIYPLLTEIYPHQD